MHACSIIEQFTLTRSNSTQQSLLHRRKNGRNERNQTTSHTHAHTHRIRTIVTISKPKSKQHNKYVCGNVVIVCLCQTYFERRCVPSMEATYIQVFFYSGHTSNSQRNNTGRFVFLHVFIHCLSAKTSELEQTI